MSWIETKTKVVHGVQSDKIPYDEIVQAEEPVIFRGAAKHWGLVQSGLASEAEAMDYMQAFHANKKMLAFIGEPDIDGYFFYNEALTGINFKTEWLSLADFFDGVKSSFESDAAKSFFIGSSTVDESFPEFRKENDILLADEIFEKNKPIVSVWFGNRTVTPAHYDYTHNIACNLVGKRRFTLFPPEQVANLYPGPLEPTPGGQVVTMADLRNPDFQKFPRLNDAFAAAQVAELEPGDILYYPPMWWHQVESLGAFNVMMNYWWNSSPLYIDTPQITLLHGILSLRNRTVQEKKAWKALFDYYIFDQTSEAVEHLPDHAQGDLSELNELKARRLRAKIISRLNR